MGTDIHLYVEKLIDGRWEAIDPPKTKSTIEEFSNCSYKDPEAMLKSQPYSWKNGVGWHWNYAYADPKYPDELGYKDKGEPVPWHTSRNYDLFAILADVRNGHGFAGCITGDGFNIISEPQGIPDDVSPKVKKAFIRWGCDAHSASHLKLKELLDFDWTQETCIQGVVDEAGYLEFKEKGYPLNYSGDIFGTYVKKISNKEMEQIISGKKKREIIESPLPSLGSKEATYCTAVKWKVTYWDEVEWNLERLLPPLKELSDGSYEDIRLVFWFDN